VGGEVYGNATNVAPAGRRSEPGAIVRRIGQMLGASAGAALLAGRERRRRRGTANASARALGVAAVSLCTRLGATFIKLGQIASTRPDLLPKPFIEELSVLQDKVAPFPFAAVRRTVEEQLGRPLEELFARFDPEPVAAASVSQVHRAVLPGTDTVVAVKVRRPDIADKVRLDRSVLVTLAAFLEKVVPSLRLVSLRESVSSFCDAVEEQLDFVGEARNNERFRANFADDPDVEFPRLHHDWCAGAVLTMDFIDGVRERDLENSQVSIEGIVSTGMRCVCRMIFSHGFVHADIHPGNVLFQAPQRIVLYDLGLVGRLTDADRLTTAKTLLAFAMGDGKTVARLFYDNAPFRATPDYTAYEAEMAALVDSLLSRGLGNLEISLEVGRIFDVLRRHRIQARSHMTMVNVALVAAEGLGKRLAPDLSLTEASMPYLIEAVRETTAAS